MKPANGLLILLLLIFPAAYCPAEAFDVIILTRDNQNLEQSYVQFLQQIYRGNVLVDVRPERYEEDLSDELKLELEAADLIIVSADNSDGDYNADAEYWASVNVPIINHCAKLARSDGHDYWDWLDGSKDTTDNCNDFEVTDANDPVFDGIDTAGGSVQMFLTGRDLEHSDQPSPGYGTAVAAVNGNVAIVRWQGGEPAYYDGSLYAPGPAPRLLFAMPDQSNHFFDDATDQAQLMLKNALFSLLPLSFPDADLDGDRDVDLDDYACFADNWLRQACTDDPPCAGADLTGDTNVTLEDLSAFTGNWLTGVDLLPPEPNVSVWLTTPTPVSPNSIFMASTLASDAENGVQYYFQCTTAPNIDSSWQYGNTYEPNTLSPATDYIFRTKARDTSGNLNENQWSPPANVRTFGIFRRIADASAGVALDEYHFVVADDEDSVLRIYDIRDPDSEPIAEPNFTQYLNLDPNQPESDIEAATWFNGRIFWLASHSRNKNGKYYCSRYQFFATSVTGAAPDFALTFDGNYTNLIDDIIAYDATWNLGLAAAIGVSDGHIDETEIPHLDPKQQGLNIEGLSVSADGTYMYIAFRNPHPAVADTNSALIIPLYNPEQVVLSGQPADLGPPILLDLAGLGIRSLEYSPTLAQFLLVAGSHLSNDDSPIQYLYQYDMPAETLTLIRDFPLLTPEALFQFPGHIDIQLLSDDGTLLIDTPEGPIQNKLLPRQQRTFRTYRLTP